jgi:putative phage-type endonuclease
MTAELVGEFEHDSPEWHAARANGIGASEIAAVAGLSPFMSAFRLWHIKKGNLPADDGDYNPYFDWGHRLEPVVAAKFADLHPEYEVSPCGSYRNRELPWQTANPDRMLWPKNRDLGSVPLEVKTTRRSEGWGPEGSVEIPPHVYRQVLQQMDVMDAPVAWVAVLISGSDYREYLIEYDESDAAHLRTMGAEFWKSLDGESQPPIDYSESTYHSIKELNPDIEEDEVEVGVELSAAFGASKETAETYAKDHAQIKNMVLDLMGNARIGTADGMPVFRRQPARYGVSLNQIKPRV